MSKHDQAIDAFRQGQLQQAVRLLEELLKEQENSELWNDWATVQLASGNVSQAEAGLLRALDLDSNNHAAKADLGILLLGRGENSRAVALIQECLPLLAPQQQEVLRIALRSATAPAGPGLCVLVVHDRVPEGKPGEPEAHLLQIVRAFQELGHSVTLISRAPGDSERLSKELGIKIYAGDVERLPCLGIQASDTGWRLEQILARGSFDFAVLTQNFSNGLSVPEHYLHAIRRLSSQTKIAILADELHGVSAAARAQLSGEFRHGELAEDWSQREREAFHKADLVWVSNRHDAENLRAQDISVAIIPYACAQSESSPADHSNRRGILLAANLQHNGPRDGLGWLVDQVWPKIRRRYSDIELRMVGGDDGRKSVQPKYPFVQWVASDQLPQLVESSRLFISPQRFGPPNLHVPAMLCAGLPGVVTTHAANCSGLRSGLLIADTPERFAGAIARLLEEKQLWGNLQFEGKMAGAAHSFAALKKHLSDTSCIAAQLAPKPQPKESFSATLVDSLYAQLLEQTSGEQRVYSRLDFYIQLAEQLLRHGKTLMAREQLRHIFGWLGDSVKLAPPLAQPLGLLKRCYRQLGDEAMAESCANEARRCFTTRSSAMAQAPTIKRKKDQPLISLIVPTYNRLPILKKCLAALEAQTASRKQFEVIVIDDGSSDGTEEFMREHKATFRLQWLRQKNSGTGTARRHGVEHATGEYLLLMNDDTIFDPAVIEEHLKAQKLYSAQKWAVLGNFEYPKEARKRALTHFFCINSFMFPQVDMEEGCPYGYSHFITCNLSIRREAVLQVGSFDGTYMLSEDTEMGIKLFEQGYSVVYHPAAHAWHDHLQYAMPNLLRRARVYGQDYFYMFRKHPRVLKEWAMPIRLTGMDPANGFRIRDYVDKHRQTIKSAVAALERWDSLDFEPILADRENERHVLSLFQQSVPAVHWFYLFERMLEVMAKEFNMPELVSPEALAMQLSAR